MRGRLEQPITTPSTGGERINCWKSEKGSTTIARVSPFETVAPTSTFLEIVPLDVDLTHIVFSINRVVLRGGLLVLILGSIPICLSTDKTPFTPSCIDASSNLRASPASYNSMGVSFDAAYA